MISLLPLEVNSVKEFIDPNEDVHPGEVVIAEANDEAKKLFTLMTSYHKLSVNYALEGKTSEAMRPGIMSEVFKHLFWVSVHEQAEHWDTALGIRRDFQIVKLPPGSILKELFNMLQT